MLRSYLTTALRTIFKHRFLSFLNIIGLAVGLAGALLIIIYLADELSYDRFHEKADRTYRMNLSGNWGGEEARGSGSPPPLAKSMLADLPEVEAAVRLYPTGDLLVRYSERVFTETKVLGVDTSFFDVFSFELIEGEANTVLSTRNSLVVTRSTAFRYFGKQNPIGKLLLIGPDAQPFSVTGVVEDPPSNSHIEFDMLASIESFSRVQRFDWSWIWLQLVTYVVLDENASELSLNAKMPALVKKYGQSVIERFSGMPYDEFLEGGGRWHFVAQRMTDIRLRASDTGNRLGSLGNIDTVYLLAVVAVLLVIIACINFINLATARSTTRRREIGVRKVVGSQKKHLVAQFLIESVILSVIAMLVALVLVELSRGFFSDLTGKHFTLGILRPHLLVFGYAGFAAIVGLLAGCYPAFYFTAFRPVEALKGVMKGTRKGNTVRSILVSTQFSISIGLIVCTLIVNKQLQYIRDKDLGFSQEGIFIIKNTERLGTNENAFRESILSYPQVIDASLCSGFPTSDTFGDFYEPEKSGVENFLLNSIKGDYDFLKTMDIKLLSGRNFSKEFATDNDAVLLNEAAVNFLGWEEPINKTLIYPGNNQQQLNVIGVIEDFHFFSLHSQIEPFAIFLFSSDTYRLATNYIAVKASPGELEKVLNIVQQQWKAMMPGAPFDFEFLDSRIAAQFRAETQLRTVFAIFTGLAIFVACVGLFGLSTFAGEQRTKEIGVRKVLGATVPSLIRLLSREFTRLVVLANIVAWPVSYWVMSNWLEEFAYRVEIDISSFALAGGLAFTIALATVSLQAIKAAFINPVDSLRYE